MLAWIMQNKEWLFSGIAVAVPLAAIGWWCSKRSGGDGKPSVHQTNSGGGDNVGRDKIVKR